MIPRKQRKQQNKAIARRKRYVKHRKIQNNNRNLWERLI